jgi:hypothetical protein
VLALGLLLTAALARAGERAAAPQFGFQLEVPDGFVRQPELVGGDILFAFRRPQKEGERFDTTILVSRLHGPLDREKRDQNRNGVRARNPQATVSTETWKAFEIDVFRVPEPAGDFRVVTLNAQVPLKPEAIQVSVAAEEAREADAREVLRSVLAKLEGESNWLTDAERAHRLGEGVGRLVCSGACCGFAVVGVGLLFWLAVRKSARRPQRDRGRE